MEEVNIICKQYESIFEAYKDKGYKFETQENVPNIFVIRRGSDRYKYRDLLGVALSTADQSHVALYPVCSRASGYHSRRGDFGMNMSTIELGQSLGAYGIGMSPYGYETLIQIDNVLVHPLISSGWPIESKVMAPITREKVYDRSMLLHSQSLAPSGIAFQEEEDHEKMMRVIRYCADIAGERNYNLTVFDESSQPIPELIK